MKFVVSSTELLQVVQNLAKAIPTKSPLPILDNFLFNLSEKSLEITASDQELTLRAEIEIENCLETGQMAVPARHMLELLKEFPDQPITISSINDSTYECSWASGSSTLPYFPAEDYPEIPEIEEVHATINFSAQTLLEGISKTLYATADEDSRPVMNGILFDITPTKTTLVASDTHKLICYTTADIKNEEEVSFILHKKTAGILKSIIGKNPDDISISFDKQYARFKIGNTVVLSRLIIGKYPKYKEVIPYQNENILDVDRIQLLNVIRRVAVCVDKASNSIKLDLNNNILEVSAQDIGFSIAGYDKLNCRYEGEQLTIGFNYLYLIDILSNLPYENVTIKFGDDKRAALIIPSEGDNNKEDICGILVPNMI